MMRDKLTVEVQRMRLYRDALSQSSVVWDKEAAVAIDLFLEGRLSRQQLFSLVALLYRCSVGV